jgi:Pyridoxamine 5'-phosphate oxidase
MKTWGEFAAKEPDLAGTGKQLLFQSRMGLAFLATLRKEGAPRLHAVSLVISKGHLYILIPPESPKCTDLMRDGRYALQAFPPPGEAGQEFYIAGRAEVIQDPEIRQSVIDDTQISAQVSEVLLELLLDRAIHTRLENGGTSEEKPIHCKWRAKEY